MSFNGGCLFIILISAISNLIVSCDGSPHVDLVNGHIELREHHHHRIRHVLFGIFGMVAVAATSFYIYKCFSDRARSGRGSFSERGVLLPTNTELPVRYFPYSFWPFNSFQPGVVVSAPIENPVPQVLYNGTHQDKTMPPWEKM